LRYRSRYSLKLSPVQKNYLFFNFSWLSYPARVTTLKSSATQFTAKAVVAVAGDIAIFVGDAKQIVQYVVAELGFGGRSKHAGHAISFVVGVGGGIAFAVKAAHVNGQPCLAIPFFDLGELVQAAVH
jgi:hypothetical protein